MSRLVSGRRPNRSWAVVAAFAVMASLPATLTAQTAEPQAPVNQEEVVRSAQAFVVSFDEGDFGELYDRDLSPTFKALQARDVFIQQGGFIRVQSGGKALAREFVGAQPFSQTPTGAKGDYYYVRFRTRHPNGLVFQDVYLEKVGAAWKVAGFYMMPAPQQ